MTDNEKGIAEGRSFVDDAVEKYFERKEGVKKMPYCDEHSGVMKSLGAIESTQDMHTKAFEKVFQTLDVIKKCVANGATAQAVDQAKMGPIFWLLTVAGGVAIITLVNVILKKLGLC